MARTAVGIPPALLRSGEQILRPKDGRGVYANPRVEFARLARTGALKRVATGYYAVVPQARIADARWRPDLESIALGIAKADYGVKLVALMGISAARYHGVIPRSQSRAVVAVPKQRPVLATEVGQVIFVKRDVTKLDLERLELAMGQGWVTTVEQTLLDLAARPSLGGLAEADIKAALQGLGVRADWELVRRLAQAQHTPRAYAEAMRHIGHADA